MTIILDLQLYREAMLQKYIHSTDNVKDPHLTDSEKKDHIKFNYPKFWMPKRRRLNDSVTVEACNNSEIAYIKIIKNEEIISEIYMNVDRFRKYAFVDYSKNNELHVLAFSVNSFVVFYADVNVDTGETLFFHPNICNTFDNDFYENNFNRITFDILPNPEGDRFAFVYKDIAEKTLKVMFCRLKDCIEPLTEKTYDLYNRDYYWKDKQTFFNGVYSVKL